MEASPAALPGAVQESLEPGETYFWQVEALSPEGTRGKSRLSRFTIRE